MSKRARTLQVEKWIKKGPGIGIGVQCNKFVCNLSNSSVGNRGIFKSKVKDLDKALAYKRLYLSLIHI